MKGLRRRRSHSEPQLSPLELALRPALVEGRWQIPDRFNFTGDVVEALARDPKRRALTCLGKDGVIEPRTFHEIAEGAAVWAEAVRGHGVEPGDRVVVLAGSTVDWLEAMLGVWKAGCVAAPCSPSVSPSALEVLVSTSEAALVVAEQSAEQLVSQMGFTPEVHYFEEGVRRRSSDVPDNSATHATSSRDIAFIASSAGTGGRRRGVAHTHGSVFATRVQAEHWLDVGRGDAVWCVAPSDSPLAVWDALVGPWSRGAEVVLHQGSEFDPDERLDLLFRLGPSILSQSPAEYRALARHPKLERFRSPRLRRLVSTGEHLDSDTIEAFEERWGMTIHTGYGQAETNLVVADSADGASKPGSMGRALPGHHVGIVDDQGNELPAGIEGDLAVRGRPPTLFAGYWESPEETKSAFRGDWYITGDVAMVDEEGFVTFVGRAEDVITSSGRTFGPHEVEQVLGGHPAIAASGVVGMRDLQRGGQFVRAFVVLGPRAAASQQLEAEIRQYAAELLPDQQVPREILFVDELPTVQGKLSRHELRERPVVGRPLWEPEPIDVRLEAAPVAPDPEPVAAPMVEPAPAAAPAPEPVAEPVVEVEAVVAPEPVVYEEPEVVVLDAPEAVVEPELEVVHVFPVIDAEPRPAPSPSRSRSPSPCPSPHPSPWSSTSMPSSRSRTVVEPERTRPRRRPARPLPPSRSPSSSPTRSRPPSPSRKGRSKPHPSPSRSPRPSPRASPSTSPSSR